MSETAPHRDSDSAEVENDSYFASLSDLMVGMLFIFIIILMAFALSYTKAANEATKAQGAANSQRDALRCLLIKNQTQLAALLDSVSQSFNSLGSDAQIQVDDGRSILRMQDNVLFDKGRAELPIRGREAIHTLAAAFEAARLQCYVGTGVPRTDCPADAASVIDGIYIEGHTDPDPISGQYKDNWDLSTARATETFRTLVSEAPHLSELKNLRGQAVFGVSGYGSERSLNSNANEGEKQRNRRIDIRFSLRSPTVEEVERAMEDAEAGRGGC